MMNTIVRQVVLVLCCMLYIVCTMHGAASSSELDIVDYSEFAALQVSRECGEHAIKNTLALYNFLAKSVYGDAGLDELLKAEQEMRSQLAGTKLSELGDVKTACADMEGLSEEDIMNFIAQLPSPLNNAFNEQNLFIGSNIADIKPEWILDEQRYQLARIAQRIQDDKPFVHALIVNIKMHWIGCVITRVKAGGNMIIYLVDSRGFPASKQNYPVIKRFVSYLKRTNPMGLLFPTIENLMLSFNNNLRNKEYLLASFAMRDILDEASAQGVLQRLDFIEKYKPILLDAISGLKGFIPSPDFVVLNNFLNSAIYSDDAWRQARMKLHGNRFVPGAHQIRDVTAVRL